MTDHHVSYDADRVSTTGGPIHLDHPDPDRLVALCHTTVTLGRWYLVTRNHDLVTCTDCLEWIHA